MYSLVESGDREEELLGGDETLDDSWAGIRLSGRKYKDRPIALLFAVNSIATLVTSFFVFNYSDLAKFEKLYRLSGDWMSNGLARVREDLMVLSFACLASAGLGAVWLSYIRRYTRTVVLVSLGAGAASLFALALYFVAVGVRSNSSSCIWFASSLIFYGAIVAGIAWRVRAKIDFTCYMFSEATKALIANPDLHAITAVSLIFIAGVSAYFLVLLVGVASIAGYGLLFWHTVFSWLWIVSVISAAYKMAVAGTVSHWYFSQQEGFGQQQQQQQNAKPDGEAVSLSMVKLAFSRSLGSVALGALVVSLIATLGWMLRRLRFVWGKVPQNRATVLVLDALIYLTSVLEELCSSFNRYAYVYIAMHGDSFMSSGRRVFGLLKQHGLDLSLVEAVSRFVLFTGKALGTSVVTMCTYAFLYAKNNERPVPGLIIVASAFLSYAILHVFATQMDFATTTVFVAYCEDVRRNPGEANLVRRKAPQDLQKNLEENLSMVPGPQDAWADEVPVLEPLHSDTDVLDAV